MNKLKFVINKRVCGHPVWISVLLLLFCIDLHADRSEFLGLWDTFVSEFKDADHSFPLVEGETSCGLYYGASEFPGVVRAIHDLQMDIQRVTEQTPSLYTGNIESDTAVIIGTVGQNKWIDALIESGKIDGSKLEGKWESFLIRTVENPTKGVKKALVIAGSDKRGTIYGIYELSKQIGVSPWHYWADVPVKYKEALYVGSGPYYSGEPKVKYRGIFINDEAPCLRNWAKDHFGGHTSEFYQKVFELILRNRGNYLWPAMWLPTVFNEDDPENARLADEYGIVMSTSHHEPMMRSHQEWYQYDGGAWNYESNRETLQQFWRESIERMGDFESVVTVGMRGDGDEAMAEDTAIDLLKTIISDQRDILGDVLEKPAEEIPQVWALYKEVQDYYDEGMRVDDDILVLFSDDNWGNVRYLPKKEDLGRKGGFGMYYHFDYVGGPVSYRWMNVTQIERVWEQMNLTYAWGVKDLWIANVGDIKPMELPISFFLDFAWNPDAIRAKDLEKYYVQWATQQFGEAYAKDIAEVLALYTKYNSRRTPEMLTADTYSIENYREADRIVSEFKALFEKSKTIYESLPSAYKSAYYQLAHYPVESCMNLNEMYVAAGKNRYYAERGFAVANYYADQVRVLFDKDAELTKRYHALNDGKWNHMMSQTHIGYTYWNHPPLNKMPAVSYVQVKEPGEIGFLIEHGGMPKWGWLDVEADWAHGRIMPVFDAMNDQTYYLELLNRGALPATYTIQSKDDWIQLSAQEGTVEFEEKVFVSVDWEHAPKGKSIGEIIIAGSKETFTVQVPVENESFDGDGFIPNDGVIVIEASNFQNQHSSEEVAWVEVPNLGRTASAMTLDPANALPQPVNESGVCLEYVFTTVHETEVSVDTFLSPTLNYMKSEGLRFAIAIDDEIPQIVNMHQGEMVPDWKYPDWWNDSVSDHVKVKRSHHSIVPSGPHTLKVWAIDPGVVLQRFVIDLGGLKPSYLGPEESKFIEP